MSSHPVPGKYCSWCPECWGVSRIKKVCMECGVKLPSHKQAVCDKCNKIHANRIWKERQYPRVAKRRGILQKTERCCIHCWQISLMTSTQKYCQWTECKKEALKAKRKAQHIEFTCAICGKKSVWNKQRKFCGDECRSYVCAAQLTVSGMKRLWVPNSKTAYELWKERWLLKNHDLLTK